MDIRYPAMIELQDEGGFTVSFPDLDEAITEGDNMEEALFNAADLLTLTLESRIDEGMDIPVPSIIEQAYDIAPSSKVQAALLVRFCRGERSLADLARSLETSWPAASRLEDPHQWPSLKQLDRAASAFGKRLVLSFE